jgi:arsenate reductase
MSESEIIRVAFICTANAARSQIAEGLTRAWAKENVWVESAGLRPMGLARTAIEVMAEIGIDISHQRSKGIEELGPDQDYVITVCDNAAEYCGTLPAKRENLHWPIPDPGGMFDCPGDTRQLYRQAREMLATRIQQFLAERNLLRGAVTQQNSDGR